MQREAIVVANERSLQVFVLNRVFMITPNVITLLSTGSHFIVNCR